MPKLDIGNHLFSKTTWTLKQNIPFNLKIPLNQKMHKPIIKKTICSFSILSLFFAQMSKNDFFADQLTYWLNSVA